MAADSFNRAWNLLDKRKRSVLEDLTMLNLAHASRFNWGLVGTPRNRAVGDWQLSRIYSELGHPKLALMFARSCLTTCQRNKLGEILHTAEEGMARAYAVSKKYDYARRYLDSARRRLDRLEVSDGDRKTYLAQIKETERLIRS